MSSTPAKLSTVLKGTTFENRTLRLAREHLSMSLRRVGGSGDGGIDLQGWWWLPRECLDDEHPAGAPADSATPATRLAIRVLAQCKAEAKKAGPRHIREFEGTILRHSAYLTANESVAGPGASSRNAVVGLFASTSPFTKASLLQAYSSPIPLALLHLPEPPDSEEPISPERSLGDVAAPEVPVLGSDDALTGTLVFNPALSGAGGLLRGRIEPRWERSMDGMMGRPGIWSDGRRLDSWIREDGGDILATGLFLPLVGRASTGGNPGSRSPFGWAYAAGHACSNHTKLSRPQNDGLGMSLKVDGIETAGGPVCLELQSRDLDTRDGGVGGIARNAPRVEEEDVRATFQERQAVSGGKSMIGAKLM
ncbi:hypothetical protein OH76DRAFT_1469297 [Lentinus brumalis]|uniref:Uncharacterized protein n=1 Tax=Lentinus brumalis TaxID=2498619 RepID=A0A371DQ11_9APHY|nr:hypothetical protein OH76DRAFT_1469297 [Polyporus brumalis]